MKFTAVVFASYEMSASLGDSKTIYEIEKFVERFDSSPIIDRLETRIVYTILDGPFSLKCYKEQPFLGQVDILKNIPGKFRAQYTIVVKNDIYAAIPEHVDKYVEVSSLRKICTGPLGVYYSYTYEGNHVALFGNAIEHVFDNLWT